jgi:hypothetical protein
MIARRKLFLIILMLCLLFDGIAWFVTYRYATAPSAEELRQTPPPADLSR